MIEPCGADCPLCEADRAARERGLATHRRYNLSAKGQARNRAYEDRHPERKLRWEPARNAARNPNGKRPETDPVSVAEAWPDAAPPCPVCEAAEYDQGSGGVAEQGSGGVRELCTVCEGA